MRARQRAAAELQVAATNGSIVIDSRGRKYIDFVMGWCVGNFEPKNDGKTVHRLEVTGDVPVDGFWSISVYGADGYFDLRNWVIRAA